MHFIQTPHTHAHTPVLLHAQIIWNTFAHKRSFEWNTIKSALPYKKRPSSATLSLLHLHLQIHPLRVLAMPSRKWKHYCCEVCLNKGLLFSAEEELGQIWPWLFTAQTSGERRHCESLCSTQSFVICEGLTLNSHLGEHQRQLHQCKTFWAWFDLKMQVSLLPWKCESISSIGWKSPHEFKQRQHCAAPQ